MPKLRVFSGAECAIPKRTRFERARAAVRLMRRASFFPVPLHRQLDRARYADHSSKRLPGRSSNDLLFCLCPAFAITDH